MPESFVFYFRVEAVKDAELITVKGFIDPACDYDSAVRITPGHLGIDVQ